MRYRRVWLWVVVLLAGCEQQSGGGLTPAGTAGPATSNGESQPAIAAPSSVPRWNKAFLEQLQAKLDERRKTEPQFDATDLCRDQLIEVEGMVVGVVEPLPGEHNARQFTLVVMAHTDPLDSATPLVLQAQRIRMSCVFPSTNELAKNLPSRQTTVVRGKIKLVTAPKRGDYQGVITGLQLVDCELVSALCEHKGDPMPFNSPELVRASQEGDLTAVRELVESGADVNSVGDHGMGPLLTFTPDVTAYLLSQGADPNRQTNENGDPVLLGIAYFNNVQCVRLLLEAGADPQAVVKETGETALHACVIGLGENVSAADRHEVVKLLIERGADPNRRTIPGMPTLAFWRDVRTRGETPLHRAAAYAAEETVEFLLKAGADKTIRDANGDSPQSWASWHWRSKRLIDVLDPQRATGSGSV